MSSWIGPGPRGLLEMLLAAGLFWIGVQIAG